MDDGRSTALITCPRTADDWLTLWSHRADLERIARRRCPAVQDVDDIVQEAIVRAAANQDVDAAHAAPWLTRVVVNLCHDLHRRPPTHDLEQVDVPHQATSVEDTAIARDELARVRLRFARLPERQRQAMALRASGLDVDAVARRLGTTYKTTESLLSRGRAALRGSLVLALAALAYLRRTSVASTGLALTSVAATLAPLLGSAPAPAHPVSEMRRQLPVSTAPATPEAPAPLPRVDRPAPPPAPRDGTGSTPVRPDATHVSVQSAPQLRPDHRGVITHVTRRVTTPAAPTTGGARTSSEPAVYAAGTVMSMPEVVAPSVTATEGALRKVPALG